MLLFVFTCFNSPHKAIFEADLLNQTGKEAMQFVVVRTSQPRVVRNFSRALQAPIGLSWAVFSAILEQQQQCKQQQ